MRRRWERSRERLDCLIHGHRDLSRAPAYAERQIGAGDKELRYCGSCGGPAWVPTPEDRTRARTWAGEGLPAP